MKVKIEELETNSKVNNVSGLYRDIDDLKKGYQPRTTYYSKGRESRFGGRLPQYYGEVEELFLPAIECT